MAKPVVMQYSADINKAMKALTAVIARLGYTVKSVDKENGLITFETGMSMRSWAGQSMSVHVLDADDGVQITVGGTMKAHGAQIQVYDWGESAKIATKVFDQLRSVLGPGELISGSLSSSGGNAVAVLVIIGLVVLVLVILAMANW